MKHTSEEIKYRLSDLGVQIGNIALDYITELEKENAELKSGCGMCYRKDKEQLTKAKEIIRECIKHTCDTFCEVSTCEHCLFKLKVKDKAEQFLNSEEK